MNILINILANSQQSFINLTRISIFIVMVWIGGLKAYQYEADGIVPFVINSPFMSFFYNNADKTVIDKTGKQVAEHTLYKNPEGKTVQKNVEEFNLRLEKLKAKYPKYELTSYNRKDENWETYKSF